MGELYHCRRIVLQLLLAVLLLQQAQPLRPPTSPDQQQDVSYTSPKGLHIMKHRVITQLPIVYRADNDTYEGSVTDPDTLQRLHRQEEYYSTLTYNLARPFVATITLLLEREGDRVDIVRNIHSHFRNKLRFVRLNRRATYKDMFQHAMEHYGGKTVIIVHADIELEAGFEKLRFSKFTEPTVIALVRSYRYC